MPTWLLILLELACIGVVVAGIALVYVPAAMIAGGVAGVVMCERAASRPRPAAAREPRP